MFCFAEPLLAVLCLILLILCIREEVRPILETVEKENNLFFKEKIGRS